MGLDHLKRPKSTAKPPTTPKPAPVAKTPPPAAKPKEPTKKPLKPYVPVESILFQCGHLHSAGLFAGKVCPECQSKKNEAKKAKKRKSFEKWQARTGEKKYDDPGRLPDGSVFRVMYDAGAQLWSGLLNVPHDGGSTDFRGSHSGVFKLLRLLDDQYRKWAAENQAQQNPATGVESGDAAG